MKHPIRHLPPRTYAVVLHAQGDAVITTPDPVQAHALRTADRIAMTEEEEVAHRDTCKHPGDIREANGTIITTYPRPECCDRVEAPNPTTYDLGETWTCRSCNQTWHVARSWSHLNLDRVPTWRKVGPTSFLVMLWHLARRNAHNW